MATRGVTAPAQKAAASFSLRIAWWRSGQRTTFVTLENYVQRRLILRDRRYGTLRIERVLGSAHVSGGLVPALNAVASKSKMTRGTANRPEQSAASLHPMVILLRGAPGVGKSTVASVLGSRGVVRSIVEVDAIRRLVVGVQWGDRHIHNTAMSAAALTAAEFAIGGFGPVLLVDCFGRDQAQTAAAIVSRAGADVAVLSLWASPETLCARLAGRVNGYNNASMALLINAEMKASDSASIDTSALTAQQVAERVWNRIGAL